MPLAAGSPGGDAAGLLFKAVDAGLAFVELMPLTAGSPEGDGTGSLFESVDAGLAFVLIDTELVWEDCDSGLGARDRPR
jgi:hypothetical protein